jgi:hypothetical protein
MGRYDTNLASEFYILSILHRLGAEPSLTLANKKAVDIYVATSNDEFITIDVKGVAGPFDWPAGNIQETKRRNHYYVLVSYEGAIQDPSSLPSVWVIPSNEISNFIKQYKNRTNISRALVKKHGEIFKDAWSLIVSKDN